MKKVEMLIVSVIVMNDCKKLLRSDVHRVNPFDGEINDSLLLSWDHLSVELSKKRENLVDFYWRKLRKLDAEVSPQKILKDVSGYTETGQLVAIMGPSGAGKTTLLATLARLNEPVAGSIRLNGVELSKRDMSKLASFVPQNDPLPRMLTTGEYISFSCALKLDKCTSAREKTLLTMRIIDELGLMDCRDILISKISGGERKRVSIAAEIITKPRILLLDEPTTGLDSCSAFRVIQSIKIVARDSIVLCSIHQPGITLYNLFTHVVFLTEGRTAFFGSLEDAKIFFQSEGYHCPHGFDEAEYCIKIISSRNPGDSKVDNYDNIERICDAYDRSSFSDFSEKIKRAPVGFEIMNIEHSARWFTQFNWLTWRIYLESRGTMINGSVAFLYYAVSIVLIGIFYVKINTERQSGVKDVMGMLYMTGTELVYSSAYTVLYGFQAEIPIYLRERKFYGASAYYLAMVFSWVPRVMVKSLFLTILISFMLKYDRTFFIFMEYFIITTACGICASVYGIMMASHIEKVNVATSIMAPIDLLALLMAGVFYNLRTLSWISGWLKYLSIFHYLHEMMAIIHWSGVERIECDIKNLHCLKNGTDVLAEYGYSQGEWWATAGGLMALTVSMFFIGFLGVLRRRVVKSLY